jgi:hypothetical protein
MKCENFGYERSLSIEVNLKMLCQAIWQEDVVIYLDSEQNGDVTYEVHFEDENYYEINGRIWHLILIGLYISAIILLNATFTKHFQN